MLSRSCRLESREASRGQVPAWLQPTGANSRVDPVVLGNDGHYDYADTEQGMYTGKRWWQDLRQGLCSLWDSGQGASPRFSTPVGC